MKPLVSAEVRDALASGRPVVALETSVVAQGLPRPHNLQAARACEQAVRDAGAVPAATAVVDGVLRVGLERAELERLASEAGLLKLGSRDLCVAAAQQRTGGTTVSATCELAASVGVRLFATGGIGGVHRGVEREWDISQDLQALARFPVAVVCAGAKSILDLPKTLEHLEALGVPVVGVRTGEFPAFFSASSGLALEHRVEDPGAAAAVVHARLSQLGQGGMVLAQPPPAEVALPREQVEEEIRRALSE
ncbi:MAG: pseudouridine-5'-phosphate glycosidase, partial [Deltaproteobacteria bacterium]|nr:pseudouridine-5'-phosphate glycosidase [Deltaproteobacteria bacterium]